MIFARSSAPLTEALAWLHGRTWLPPQGPGALHDRMYDTAYVAETGHTYAICPPMMTIFCLTACELDRLVSGADEPPDIIQGHWFVPALIFPLVGIAYFAFLSQTREPPWAALMGFGLLAATAAFPVTVWSSGGNAGYTNHLWSIIGTLLIAGDLLGWKRCWPAAIGLIIGAWSRQMTIFFAAPMFMAAWKSGRKRRDVAIVASAVAIAVAGLISLNAVRFGSPLNTGYALIYEGRDDILAVRSRIGLFSLRFLPDNLWYMLCHLPVIEFDLQGISFSGHADGNSMIFSTPLVILIFVAAGTWWKDHPRRWLMLASAPVLLGNLLYHAPGFLSTGCYRFGLDVLPMWMMVAAPALVSPRWRWWTIACIGWSVAYFQLLDRIGS